MVFERCRHFDPGMLSRFVYRESRCAEVRIGKRAYRYGDHVGELFQLIVHRRSAIWTEMESDGLSAVGRTHVLTGPAFNAYAVARKSSLNSEDAARTQLTSKTVADRHAHRFAADFYFQLPATAACMDGHKSSGAADTVETLRLSS